MVELILDNLNLLLALIGAGGIAGIAAGMFGIGGGVIIVPALYFTLSSLGYSETAMHVSVGTSLATIIATSIRSVLAHHSKGAVDVGVLKSWGPTMMMGALAGGLIASIMSGRGLTIFFGFVALILAAQLVFGRPNWRLAKDVPNGPMGWAVSSIIGVCSSLMGIGGGVFGVTTMVLCGRPIHQAIGTSAGFGALIGFAAVIGYAFSGWGEVGLPPFSIGYLSLPGFLLIAAMTTSLAPLGARFAHGFDGVLLKKIFGVLLTLMAINMLYRAFAG
ncbi:sulfite exporter TauE/SafE family protein [Hirschia maritima]|uniref:sulfite exporter TauE/SafE family protein n=1 Tax=Hirschia maritima TaxID=1121961 RepID=UPI000372A01A|nr:sulfite exporter TauE/SafE family protein [Hirschia maritima]